MLYNSQYFFYYYYVVKRDFLVFNNKWTEMQTTHFKLVIRLMFKDISMGLWGRGIIVGLFFIEWFSFQKPKFLFCIEESSLGQKKGDFLGFQVTLFFGKVFLFFDFFINFIYGLFFSGLFYQYFIQRFKNVLYISVKFTDILFYFNIIDYEYLYDLYFQFNNARLMFYVVEKIKCFYRSSFLFGNFQFKVK